jgi:glycosyltransferase involved in cell wall biosynthesis
MTFKVLQVIPSLASVRGGPTEVVINLTKALRKQGITVEIVTTNDNGSELLEVPLQKLTTYRGVPVRFFSRFDVELGRDRGFLFSPSLTQWLWENVRNYDILDNHYLFSYSSSCAGAIARWFNVPYTVRTMGQLSPWALAQSQRKKQLYGTLLERKNLNKAAAIHCTSLGEVQDVRKFGIHTSTITLPLGVNLPEIIPHAKKKLCYEYNLNPELPILLFLSRLHYKKRLELLLQALHQMKADRDFYLLIAGTGETAYINQIKQQIQDLNLESNCRFIGFITGETKDLVLQGSDVFVLPSYAENFALAVAEALAAGTPVAVTPEIQIAPEIVQADAGLVVEGTTQAFGEAIAQLLESPELRSQYGQNGRKLVQERFVWDAIAKRLIPLYQTIIDDRPLPPEATTLLKLP